MVPKYSNCGVENFFSFPVQNRMENKSPGWFNSCRDTSIYFHVLLHASGPSQCFSTQNGPTGSTSKPKCSYVIFFPCVMLHWACLTAGQTETKQLLQYQVQVSPIPVSSTHSLCQVGYTVSTHGRHRLDEGLENLRKI